MSTLLDLTQQGDVATMGDAAALGSKVKLMSPQQLYELWERQQWQSHTLDFDQDRSDWESLDEATRDDVLWGLSSFFIGEERVTTQFSGLVMAYEDEQEEAFLTTQQVDEARHMQFFDRFYRDVLGFDEELVSHRLERVREQLNESFSVLFDEALVQAGQALIANPGDMAAKVRFVTTYHMVIEGTLALTGQYFITDWAEREGIFPAFVDGFKNVSRDEHRHVAYGTWLLQQKAKEAEYATVMQDTLMELLPVAAGVLVPKGADPGEEWTLLGYSSQQVNEFAFTALTRRLKAIGVGLPVPA